MNKYDHYNAGIFVIVLALVVTLCTLFVLEGFQQMSNSEVDYELLSNDGDTNSIAIPVHFPIYRLK